LDLSIPMANSPAMFIIVKYKIAIFLMCYPFILPVS
jgi:hypothetical protein